MKSQREVTRKYNQLLKDVAEKEFYKVDLTKRFNCYTCQKCNMVTKTKDVDAGVTPFYHNCHFCGVSAVSSFYKDNHSHLPHHGEWFRPSLEDTLKMRSKPYLIDHILQGGLLYRRIK